VSCEGIIIVIANSVVIAPIDFVTTIVMVSSAPMPSIAAKASRRSDLGIAPWLR
jgi:hypothetical protein